MGVLETTQARRAALLLHALSPAIRRQVAGRLDAAESARLQPLLDELVKLGVSQSLGEKLQYLTSPMATSSPMPVSMAAVDKLTVQKAARLTAEDVVKCLQSCAPATAARLLHAHDWPWKAQVLELMPEARRAEVLDCTFVRSELAPAVLEALSERLCLQAGHPAARQSAPIMHRERSGHTGVRAQVRSVLKRLLAWIR